MVMVFCCFCEGVCLSMSKCFGGYACVRARVCVCVSFSQSSPKQSIMNTKTVKMQNTK